MRFVIVTGLSGSGKTGALKHMEDMGFFCVDNLPPALLPRFADMCFTGSTMEKVAVGIDMRGREFFAGLPDAIKYMEDNRYEFEVLFLYATTLQGAPILWPWADGCWRASAGKRSF